MPKTFICVASGPSLTADDCTLASDSGYPVIAVNSSWRVVPECQHIYAADFSWWEKYHSHVPTGAKRWTSSVSAAIRYGLNHFPHPDNESFNSGQRAILLAAYLGAERVILLGYDCALENGTHWHGEHSEGLKNPDAESIRRWQEEFQYLADSLQSVSIINSSRQTALSCFPRVTPEEVL